MNLNLIEKFLLIALSDEGGQFVTDTTYLRNGIAGSILLELVLEKRIDVVDKKVHVIDETPLENTFLSQTINAIERSPDKESLPFWMATLYANAREVKQAILDDLVDKEVLKEIKGKFLWLFAYYRYPTNNPVPEDQVRARLHDVIDQKVPYEEADLMLLNLIDVCSLNVEAFSEAADRQKAKNLLLQTIDSIDPVHKAIIQATLQATVSSTSPDS
jgi:hypothetical protein